MGQDRDAGAFASKAMRTAHDGEPGRAGMEKQQQPQQQ
jgi:hypothetical protein